MVGNGTDESQDTTGRDEIPDGGIILDNDGGVSASDSSDGIPTLSPQEIIIPGDTVAGDGPRRRGRKPGSKNAAKQPSKEVSQDLAGLLLSIHLMGAALLKVPELALTPDEADNLGAAVARVNKEFGVQIMSPKMAAIVNLGIVAGTVYGPRAVALYHNDKKKKEEKKHAGVNGSGAVQDYQVQ